MVAIEWTPDCEGELSGELLKVNHVLSSRERTSLLAGS